MLFNVVLLHVFTFFVHVVMSATISRVKRCWISLDICFVLGSCFIDVICIYLRILVSNTISISDDVHVV
jgi:hypothetical protein